MRSVTAWIQALLIPEALSIDTELDFKKYHFDDNELVIIPVDGLTHQA